MALIHSFNANKLLLISAPSSLVYLLVSVTSAPLSDPARSIKLSLPQSLYLLVLSLSDIYNIAWDRDESLFMPVYPVILTDKP